MSDYFGESKFYTCDAAYMTVKWLQLSEPTFIVGASPSLVMRCGPYRLGLEL